MRERKAKRWFSYRSRLIIIIIGSAIGLFSILFINNMARKLREKEQYEIQLWSYAMEKSGALAGRDPLVEHIKYNQNTVPYVVTDGRLKVQWSHMIPQKVLNHPDKFRAELERLASLNEPIRITNWDGSVFYIFYGESRLLKTLLYFPFIQVLVIAIFTVFGYITFRSSKQDEQNRVWIGLAKETAHQLGTPTSSLLGWIEYLKGQPVDQTAVTEMNSDLTRLMKVVDRFSKIGSETSLSSTNVNETVGSSVLYFRSRIPKNVSINYNGFTTEPVYAMINSALFEWVIENLLKNSLDALQGKGSIDVNIIPDENKVYIDVTDTGKGISKANFKRIFEPGFTTKTRGWGLGLSLSRRIIETYHKGRIYVLNSEPGCGTTIRVTLDRTYD